MNKDKNSVVIDNSNVQDLNFISSDTIMIVFKNCNLNINAQSQYNNIRIMKILSCKIDNFHFIKYFKNLRCLIIRDSSGKNIDSLSFIIELNNLIYHRIEINNIESHISNIINSKFKILQ